MFYPGLVSISFRSLSPADVINACLKAGLRQVEWGSDSHVTTPEAAEKVYAEGADRGVLPCSCGSYYKLGLSKQEDFPLLLKIAQALHTNIIRIWGGNRSSALLSPSDLGALAKEAYELATLADACDITLCLECHPNTVTDRYEAELAFLKQVDHPRLKTYWQPNQFESLAYNLEAAEALAPYTKMIHVYAWTASERFPLAHDLSVWEQYLALFHRTGGTYGTLLEFMPDNLPETLPQEAKTLKELLSCFS